MLIHASSKKRHHRHHKKRRVCQLCDRRFNPCSPYERFCRACKKNNQLYHLAETFPQLDESLLEDAV